MAFMQPIQPWQLLLVSLAGWINRHQQDVVAYIQEENRILKGMLKGRRIRFTDDERRRPRSGFNRLRWRPRASPDGRKRETNRSGRACRQ